MRRPGRSDGLDRVTIEEVASTARVSTATVSRFMTRPDRVSDRLAARVRAAVAELGYVPNAAARALASLRSGLLGIVATRLEDHAALVVAMGRVLADLGYAMLVEDARTPSDIERAVHALTDRDIEGVLSLGAPMPAAPRALLSARSIPWRVWDMGDPDPSDGSAALLGVAGRVVADTLSEMGHRRIVVLSPEPAAVYARALEAGIARAGGIPVLVPARCETMRALAAHLRGEDTPSTAWVCDTDMLAAAALQACAGLAISVPQEVSVVGFGDQPFGAWATPSLATVRMPVDNVASQLVAGVLTVPAVPAQRDVAPKLVVRRSLDRAPGFT